MRHPALSALALALAMLPAAAPPAAAPKLSRFLGCGADAAAIQGTVDAFRAELGSNNGVGNGGTFAAGRREINWDGVPDQFADPNDLPLDFFNVNSPRGAVLSTPGSAVRVSANATNPTDTPVEFGSLNATYPDEFATFSPQRLFAPIGANVTEVRFFVAVANSTTPAVVRGFGAVFTDVERRSKTTFTYYNEAGDKIAKLKLPPGPDGGLCFLGALDFRKARPGISRVRVVTGTTALGADDGGRNRDVVVMDDFIYGEPGRSRSRAATRRGRMALTRHQL